MTDTSGAILVKLESLGKNQERMEKHIVQMDTNHGERLSCIETTIGKLAVQDEKLSTLKTEDKAQWTRIDSHSNQIDSLKFHQAKCPLDKVSTMEYKIAILDLCQAKCPATNAKYHLAGMWVIVAAVGLCVLELFKLASSNMEKIAGIIKSGVIK